MIRLMELSKQIGVSRPTLYKWMNAGLPVYYVNRIPFFKMEEVEMWIRTQSKKR